jgi:membrane protease subunit (stomatin/prohibitin family)
MTKLIDFLNHTNPEVRVEACSAFLQYIQHEEYLKYLRENPKKAIESLVNLIKDKNGGILKLSLLCLINLNGEDKLNLEMYQMNVIDNMMTILKQDLKECYTEVEAPEILEFSLILLNNLTTDEKVAKKLLQGNLFEQLNGFKKMKMNSFKDFMFQNY